MKIVFLMPAILKTIQMAVENQDIECYILILNQGVHISLIYHCHRVLRAQGTRRGAGYMATPPVPFTTIICKIYDQQRMTLLIF